MAQAADDTTEIEAWNKILFDQSTHFKSGVDSGSWFVTAWNPK